MIVMKGPHVSYFAASRLAYAIHKIDSLAVVVLDDKGRVTVREMSKAEDVETFLRDLVNSRYHLGGRKWEGFNVRLVRLNEPTVGSRRDIIDLR
ncbi:MAG: hypothetical protein UU59_C0021G0009 [candidate division WWE3 bacterium GW2011_GWE1_41_27]|uniref:Uncharacterized protein n=2 Tax=Katanobacteria TaxID=422282 RepID=A0A0G1AFJ9_UNCKA|nr:MAG: hypothetical protein UU59_C0021G0009 [candidate division WWE3 bacterium GW2011_GWE1_41_27]KKS59817.1 MAG: hypothetical protein UV26_C0014G0010 [candidate division WWE3 bacterium GW2011_GWF2_42_42]